MPAPSVTSVTVADDGVDRAVTIVVGEGRRENGYTCEPDTVPPRVRAYLLGWLGGAETPAADGLDGTDGRGQHGAGRSLGDLAPDAPGPAAVGFMPDVTV